MDPKLIVRAEQLEDAPRIADLVRHAYADVTYSDHREHLMVDRLRESAAYVRELSLIAEADNSLVGHVLLTRATIVSERSTVMTLALAPLSVAPGFQGLGIGKKLATTAHEIAVGLGFQSIVLVGIPGYYAQFGYRRLSEYPISLPFDAPDANCMIRALRPGALDHVAGRVHYAEEWLDH